MLSIQTCCPTVAAGLAPVQPAGVRDSSCALVPSEQYDDARTMAILQQVGGCAVTAAWTRRPDLTQLVNWLRANPPPPRGGPSAVPVGAGGGTGGPQPPAGLCPRNLPFTGLKCHTMQGLFDFTVCEQCFADVIKPDADKGVNLALWVNPSASVMPAGFTCQLYSERMRRVWSEAASTGNMEHLRQKVTERRTKERELQMKTAQLRQQAGQLREQAATQEHLAANAMRPDFSQTQQLNNQAAMLKVQAAQAESQIGMAEEEWRRFFE
ncbi:hypothetical protein B0H63DRAFT_394871 [Podospora didyma]|uniref:Uncharacterized protein n=1 Tax=Podospora didyma TaxID=330526 RepID=A0AAE0TZ33_9PEZI|nr:hypothetical protein B0H63DRAFT_394871 [Podospora didyma]